MARPLENGRDIRISKKKHITKPATGGGLEAVGIYIHTPFCTKKCVYCDFNTYAGQEELIDDYALALIKEIEARAGGPRKISTIYFGGGNPLKLGINNLTAIMNAVRQHYDVEKDAEISLEANPENVDKKTITLCRGLGFNRLSLGFQSFDDEKLAFLGRAHTSSGAIKAFKRAFQAGFNNINIDLIFGLPGQSVKDWRRELRRAVALRPRHISAYGLSVEPGTPLYNAVKEGKVSPTTEEVQAKMMAEAHTFLSAGYHHYEISNFAEAGYECRHNLNYWRAGDYLGFGAGACGCVGGKRRYNLSSPRAYIEKIAAGLSPVAEVENLSRRQRLSECLFLGLRLVDGFTSSAVERSFACNLNELFKKQLAELTGAGLMEAGARWRLTDRGRLLANEVMSEFV